jgi:hypothetical protein
VPAPVAGQWDFENGNLKATFGQDLQFFDSSLADRHTFGTTGTGAFADVPGINGQPAKIICIPRQEDESFRKMGLLMTHGIAPNGAPTATKVNQWTLIMDVYWGEGHAFGTAFRTHDLSQNNDGDMFWQSATGSYGKNCCSDYAGIDPAHIQGRAEWARVVFAADLGASPRLLAKYINGFKHRQDIKGDADALDSRYALEPQMLLFNDGDDNEQSTVYVNSIQIREGKMTDEEVADLGGPSATGIPGVGATVEPPVSAPPKLLANRNGLMVVISWDPAATGFVLEETGNLNSPITWTAVTGVANNSATVQIGSGSKFYRLRKQ